MNTFLYINIYINFQGNEQLSVFLDKELGLHAKQKMFLECFFPSLEQKERKCYEQKHWRNLNN